MKVKAPKTEVQLRAALRANEQRRAEHAFNVLNELVSKHELDERRREAELQELHMLKVRLLHAIQHQHIKDVDYAKFKMRNLEVPTENF